MRDGRPPPTRWGRCGSAPASWSAPRAARGGQDLDAVALDVQRARHVLFKIILPLAVPRRGATPPAARAPPCRRLAEALQTPIEGHVAEGPVLRRLEVLRGLAEAGVLLQVLAGCSRRPWRTGGAATCPSRGRRGLQCRSVAAVTFFARSPAKSGESRNCVWFVRSRTTEGRRRARPRGCAHVRRASSGVAEHAAPSSRWSRCGATPPRPSRRRSPRRSGRPRGCGADDRRRPAPGEVHVALGHVEDHDAVRAHARRQRHVQDELATRRRARDALVTPMAMPFRSRWPGPLSELKSTRLQDPRRGCPGRQTGAGTP